MDPQQGPPQQDLLIGQTIGNYLVTQKLGEGGMGAVYLAEHPSIGKKVALKVLHSEFSSNQEVAARFFNEAKAVNDIGHPNIVDIIDFGIIQAGVGREQLVYFIMEYLSGQTLSGLIRQESPLPPERALGIALQVADALTASHRCGIVHRDLKPDNIMLQQRARERDFVKLLDYGIAKLTGDSVGSRRTRTGIVMGTPAYMSPEQCEGRGNIDHRTDIYALGIVLYEMLTGRVPFIGEGYGEILVQHLTRPPTPPSQIRMLNPHVEAVVMKALEKRADMRYPTMDEMIRAMSDPVGFVEAHGGLQGFLQRQLMPSNAPLPSGRLTPPQIGPSQLGAPGTPLPGTLMAPTGGVASRTGSGLTPGIGTPVPTTLGGATGQVQTGGGKTGFIVAALLVVVVAAVAIAVVVSDTKDTSSAGGGPDSGSEVASGSDATAGSQVATGSDATAGSQAGHTTGSNPGDTGSATVERGSAAGGDPPVAHTGSGATDTGSAGDTGSAVPTIAVARIQITTSPPNARIFIDDKEQRVRTPQEFEYPRGKAAVKLVLKLRDHEDYVVDALDIDADAVNKTYTLRRKRPNPPSIGRGSGSAQGKGSNSSSGVGKGSDSSGRGSATTRGSNDTQLIRPGD